MFIAPRLVNDIKINVSDQAAVDKILLDLDGSENKNKLGANAIMAVSLAVCRAGAAEKGCALYKHIGDLFGNSIFVMPVPFFTVFSGGKHSGNKVAYQEFMIAPVGANSFREAMRMGSETFHHLETIVKGKFGIDAGMVGDEGGLAPNLWNTEEAIDLINDSIRKAGYIGRIEIAIDVSASTFYKKTHDKYDLDFKNPKSEPGLYVSADHMLETYKEVLGKHHILSVTDPFEQDQWDNWIKLKEALPNMQLVGDDLLVTNFRRMKIGIEKSACNCMSFKINQIGSLTEALKALAMAREEGWSCLVSERAAETDDTFIADLAVGINSGQIKAGGLCRTERLSKYNQLLRIEESLGRNAKYAGIYFRTPEAVMQQRKTQQAANPARND